MLEAAVPVPLRVLLSRAWSESQADRPTAAQLVERFEAAARVVVAGDAFATDLLAE